MKLKAPFPWFGGKRRVAELVWARFGDVPNYVEPFAGSLAVLLGRPHEPRAETVNDLDCYLANFWRAVQHDPVEVATWADAPVNEADLHARHQWLVDRADFRERMKVDPDHYDAKVAGWWVWGISQWIGSGWCSRPEWRGRVKIGKTSGVHGTRVDRKQPDLYGRHGAIGKGVHVGTVRKRVVLGRGGRGVNRQTPDLSGDSGAFGRGVHACALDDRGGINAWFDQLTLRLRRVRVCCGDWKRILGPSPTVHIGTTAVFLDPPYSGKAGRRKEIYAEDCLEVAHACRVWAIEHGDDRRLRIALCGYEGEHDMPASWTCVAWKAVGGYGSQGSGAGRANAERERIWFSPHCLKHGPVGRQEHLFA